MRQNALRVKWQRGYVEVVDQSAIYADRRHEGYLSTNAASLEEAIRAGQAALAEVAAEKIGVQVTHEPLGGTKPYVDYQVGQTLALPDWDDVMVDDEVLAVAVSEDPDGNPIYEPEVAALVEDEQTLIRRMRTSITRMANDGLGGRVRAAAAATRAPATPIRPPEVRPILFSFDGPLILTTSPRWYADETTRLAEFNVSLSTAGSTTTEVKLKMNGSTIATVVVAAGDHTGFLPADLHDFAVTKDVDYLTVDVTDVGGGAGGLVAQVRRQ